MNAASKFFAPLATEELQRDIAGYAAGFITAYGVTSIALVVLSTFLWAWLAILIACAAGMVIGRIAAVHARTSGYDHAVNACAWFKGKLA